MESLTVKRFIPRSLASPGSRGRQPAVSPTVGQNPPAGAPKPKLLDQVRQAIRARHYSLRTEEAYVAWIKRFIFFHGKRHPMEMGGAGGEPVFDRLGGEQKGERLDAKSGAECAVVSLSAGAGQTSSQT